MREFGDDHPAHLSLRAGRALCTVDWPKEALAVTELRIRVLMDAWLNAARPKGLAASVRD
jgi:hypothetical protein